MDGEDFEKNFKKVENFMKVIGSTEQDTIYSFLEGVNFDLKQAFDLYGVDSALYDDMGEKKAVSIKPAAVEFSAFNPENFAVKTGHNFSAHNSFGLHQGGGLNFNPVHDEYQSDASEQSYHSSYQSQHSYHSQYEQQQQEEPEENKSPEVNKAKLDEVGQLTKWEPQSERDIYNKIREEIEKKHRKDEENETCCICMCDLYEFDNFKADPESKSDSHDTDVIKLSHCEDHYFHKECIANCMNKQCIKCPVCTHFYGVYIGDMPKGTMSVRVHKRGTIPLDGFSGVGTIEISYSLPSGRKEDGTRFSGTSRMAYLPDNNEGREILKLLRVAFDRKLTFVVGTSVTTGATNTVVWNGIHHKTSPSGGPTCWGYPDETYFDRVKEELAARGVYPEDAEGVDPFANQGNFGGGGYAKKSKKMSSGLFKV